LYNSNIIFFDFFTLEKYEIIFNNLIKEIIDHKDRQKVQNAYHFAKNAHEWQNRKSWEAYISHPVAVASTIWNRFKNIDLLISWLLHDTVEDCTWVIIEDIYNQFWDNIGFIVDSVTKTEKGFLKEAWKFNDERDKILSGWIKNIWCILLKLSDREHNLSTLSHMPKHKQIKKSFESQALYLPLMKILKFNDKWVSIENSQKYLKSYLEEQNINNSRELKNHLLNTCFHDFSEDIFDIVYNNSTNVVWEIEDERVFNSLVDSGWFDTESVEIKKIESNWPWSFKAYFIFKSGSTFDFSNWKISIFDSNFIS